MTKTRIPDSEAEGEAEAKGAAVSCAKFMVSLLGSRAP